jgi:Tol biopolymer transport system component
MSLLREARGDRRCSEIGTMIGIVVRAAAILAVSVALALLAVGCNSGGESLPTATPAPSPSATPTATATPQPTATATATPTPQAEYPPKVSLTERGVYLIRPDGTGLRHLTPGQEGLYTFRWSPDGSRIAVVTSACNAPRVSVIDVDGGGAVEVAAFDGSAGGQEWIVWGLEWSPDGRQLAVPARRYQEGEPYHTFLVNADGSGEPVEAFEGFALDWSPDGESLAFSTHSESGATLSIFDMTTDTATVIDKGSSFGYLDWSPDSERMAYGRYPTDSDPEELVVIDRDGGNRRVIAGEGSLPAWSPDGKLVAFILGSGGMAVAPADGIREHTIVASGNIFNWSPKGDALLVWRVSSLSVVSLATHEAVELAGNVLPGTGLSFSPDGQRVAFEGSDPHEEDYRNALFVVNSDGTGLQKLVRPSTAIGAHLEWSPDGRYIAFVDTIITSCP